MFRRTFAAGVAGAAGGALASLASAADLKWKWGVDVSIEHPISIRAVQAFTKIRNETSGRIDIQAFPNSSLGSDPSMLAQLRQGALEMATIAGGLLESVAPVASIENIAYAFPNRPTVFAAMDGDLGAFIRRSLIDKGVMVLDRIWDNGLSEFTTSSRPIRTVEDLAGLNIRVSPGKLRVDTIRSLGASPIPTTANELYTSLQTHIVDGQESPLIAIETFRVFEVQKYCSLTHHKWSGFWNLINMDKWRSLSPDLQGIVSRNLNQAALQQRRDFQILSGSLVDKLHRQGLTFNEPSPASFRAKLGTSGYYGRWRAEYGEQAWSALEKYTGRLA